MKHLLAIYLLGAAAAVGQQHYQAPHQAPHALGEGVPMPRADRGKPFSATAKTQTVQTLLDGTHVNKTTTTLIYRDFEGRVRSETSGHVVIQDPVSGVTYRLDPASRTAVKEMAHGHEEHAAAIHQAYHGNENTEDLGISMINGVTVHGARITVVVPVGAIGNDREFRSINEHWYSAELNLIIKSASTDPRFGSTTYELSNINRQTPDAALFQVPPSYEKK